jgi:Domain of unknown function (DUF6398)
VVWALGEVSFLFDPSTEPYVAQDNLAGAFGLSKSTLNKKSHVITPYVVSGRRCC